MPVDRFTVSLDTELLAAFDARIAVDGYANRSEAIRDLIRDHLIAGHDLEAEGAAVVVLAFLTDTRVGRLPEQLRDALVAVEAALRTATLLTPIDAHHDHWTIVVRGSSEAIGKLVNAIRGLRGLSHLNIAAVPTSDP